MAQNYRTGQLRVLDVPPPVCRPGGALVSTRYSLVSAGTELMKVAEANLSLLGKARARPDQVRKVLDSVSQQGVRSAYSKAVRQLDSYTPLGYSSCGVVVEAQGAEGLQAGQLVACAGNEYALHAELNWVPRRLCVPVPEGVDPRLAAFATVGAIALQGVRRCDAQLGDTACVVGLGLVGQLVVQLLIAAGVRVVGLDLVPDRCRLAEKAGAMACDAPDHGGLERIESALDRATGGLGADHVLLVAGGSSNGPVKAAARLARDRARVVDIGKLKMDLPWNAYYDKELDVRFSRSYGPGRYDETYELAGVDYPAGYVRWTEERNIKCFLDLLAQGELAVDLLASETFPIEEAAHVYDRMRSGALRAVGVLFEYPEPGTLLERAPATVPGGAGIAVVHPATQGSSPEEPSLRAHPVRSRAATDPRLRIGFIGAGNYASSMLLPALAKSEEVELALVATNTSLSAATAQRRFGFSRATTDLEQVLDEELDAVFIVTRHHSHAELVCRSLAAGKPTFVEKPLALSDDELSSVLDTIRTTGNDRLMVGFNRRFAPLLVDLRKRHGNQTAGSVIHYLVNAGTLPSSSWYRNTDREGSRFAGEGGHFLDTIGWWLDAPPRIVHAMTTRGRDDLHVTVRYDDGSIGAIDYVTNGHPRYPKETIEMSAGGTTARFDNFRHATLWRGRRRTGRRAWGPLDKGQGRELACFLESVRTGGPMPIPLASLTATTSATLAVDRSLRSGAPVVL